MRAAASSPSRRSIGCSAPSASLRVARPASARWSLSVCNFKGGVAKTTTTAHLAQYLCLHGYRVLAVDLDAQASLTQMFGILPHTEVPSNQTARPFFEGPNYPDGEPNPDWTGTLATAIQKTHWDQLDLIPSNLGLYGAEFSIAARIRGEENFLFYRILADALDTVKDDYDVVLLDTAPSLSFVNSNALFAADALVITLPPAFMDLQSASLFYELIADVVRTINQVQGEQKTFDFGAVLLTRFKPSDANHQKISSWIRSFLSDTFTHAMIQTVVLEKLGPRLLTLYEVDHSEESAKYEGDRRAFERAIEAMNNVNGEIAQAIHSVWERQPQVQRAISPRASAGGELSTACPRPTTSTEPSSRKRRKRPAPRAPIPSGRETLCGRGRPAARRRFARRESAAEGRARERDAGAAARSEARSRHPIHQSR